MFDKYKKSIYFIIATGLIIEIFRTISGNGIINIVKCSNEFVTTRCLGFDDDSPVTLMHDFYKLLSERKGHTAWNILSEDQQSKFIHKDPKNSKINGKNKFHHFWNEEIHDFVIFKSSYRRVVDSVADIEIYLCYKRSEIYAAEHEMSKRFCSRDNFHLIRNIDNDTPYLWSIEYINYYSCTPEEVNLCNAWNFEKKYMHFMN